MPTTNTRKGILHFALAGIAYFFVAQVFFSLVDYFILKIMGAPVRLGSTGTRMYCSEMNYYKEAHGKLATFWLDDRWLCYAVGYPLVGILLHRVSSKKKEVGKNVLMWLGILMIGMPLFQYAQGVIIETLYSISIPDYKFKVTIQQALLLTYSITIAFIAYFKLFSRRERRLLWLFSLPALIITHFTWFYIMHRFVYKY